MSDLQNVERLNFYRLSRLILDVGTHTLQSLFEKEYSATGDLQTFLKSKNHILNKLYRRKIINQTLKELLQPSNGTKPILEKFDISLVSTLLTNLCHIAQPLAGWAVPPAANDTSTGADVLRLRTARNELFAHSTKCGIDDAIFNKGWNDIVNSISRLSNQLEKKKQEQLQGQISNIKTARINRKRQSQINGQLYDKQLCDILQKLEQIKPERLEVISSDGAEDALNAEIPKGPDGIICVLKEYPKLKLDMPKDSGEAIAQYMLEAKLINRNSYDKIKDSSCTRRVCIDRLLKMVVQGKPELLECFFDELKMECPCLAIALSKREVTQKDRDDFQKVQESVVDDGIRIKVNHGIDDSDIRFFENHLCDSPEVIDAINDQLLSQFLISIWEHSRVTYDQVPVDMIHTLLVTMQLHLHDESVLKNTLQPDLFDRWRNFKSSILHQKILNTCLPIFERDLNFNKVFLLICQAELLDNSSCSDISKQATKSGKTRLLLHFLQLRDRSVYEKFKECLVLSQQSQLKNELEAEEAKLSQDTRTEETLGNQHSWRALFQWIAAKPLLASFPRHFRMRFKSIKDGSIILKFGALKDFNVELLDQSEVQKHLEKLLRKGCLDSKIKVEGPVFVTVYILSPGDEDREEDIHFHLDFEAFLDQKEPKAYLESHKLKLLVEELNPSQLHRWIFDQPEIGMDNKEKMENIVSQRDLSRREKMEHLLDNIIRLENGHGILEQFCEENDKYVYEKVFRKPKQMPSQGKVEIDPKTSLSYQKGGGQQKLYSMWMNIDMNKGFFEEDSEADKGETVEVQKEENLKKGILGDEEEKAWKAWKEKNYEEEDMFQGTPRMEKDDPGTLGTMTYKEASRLRELFHGRFSQEEAIKIYVFCNKNLQEAVNFIMNGEQGDIRNVISEGEWRIVAARNSRDINQVLKNEILDQVRQFGCESCDNVWWRRVPIRKLVSRCKSCKRKFDAIPREDEWGLAKYICSKCKHEFTGYGAMGHTMSPCYSCNNLCTPVEIFPPYNKTGRQKKKSWHVHSCSAHNCYNRNPGAKRDAMINLCVHPKSMMKSLGRKVLNPSQQHVSTGSTVKTFLNQDDLESRQYESSLDDIIEELDDGSDYNNENH